MHTKALPEDVLLSKIGAFQAVGIRSKTQLTAEVLKAGPNLLAVGCFCIGTNQVDLEVAQRRGVPVFNSPFSNSRSVGTAACTRRRFAMVASPLRTPTGPA